MVVVRIFLGVSYLLLEVSTEIHPFFFLCDDAGHIYQIFVVLYALVNNFPGGILLITLALH